MCYYKRSSPQLIVRIDFQQQVLDDDIAMQSVESPPPMPPPVESLQLDDDELSMNSNAYDIEEHLRELEEWGRWYAGLSSEECDKVNQELRRERGNEKEDDDEQSLDSQEQAYADYMAGLEEWTIEFHSSSAKEKEGRQQQDDEVCSYLGREGEELDSVQDELANSGGAVYSTCKRGIQDLLDNDTDAMQPVSKKARRSPD